MVKLELLAGGKSLFFEIRKDPVNWTVVYDKSGGQTLRLGAESFKIIKQNALSTLPPPYRPKKTIIGDTWRSEFRIFPLMDAHAEVVGHPSENGMLDILWLQWEPNTKKFTPLMTLTPEDVQAWIHTLETFEPNKLKRFTNLFKRRRT